MSVAVKRAYDPPAAGDGYRVLVDRLWPRGLSREQLQIDEWLRETAPSEELRRGLHGGELGWGEFRRAYLAELKAHRDALRRLAAAARQDRLTLVFGARDAAHNNAVVLMQYLKMLGAD
ncbi:DUF488 domain-containing protein [Thiohalobacter thiocyanaticus]|uniref:DUF488 family protein n=1 Tax=Thiohalobacter thiocyanaticus TaxID=585455 RepID=A0A426QJG9_9GAMM|nr:DUF488 family protein [Thiohalobacter thiocyanaticus]RRQ21847.1 DUF488 family protein [Thiohalobacter thiocyanaticus]